MKTLITRCCTIATTPVLNSLDAAPRNQDKPSPVIQSLSIASVKRNEGHLF